MSAVSTTLAAASAVADTNIKVASISSLVAGQTISIDTTGTVENKVIAAVGTAGAGGATTLAANAAIGATNIRVTSVTGFALNQSIAIDTGAGLETRTITGPSSGGVFNGTSGSSGTGVSFSGGLVSAHTSGAPVVATSTGVTLTTPLASAHASGATVSVAPGVNITPAISGAHWNGEVVADLTTGTGVTLSSSLTATHPAGAPVTVYGAGSAAVALTNDMPAQPAYSAAAWKARMDDAVYRMLKQLNNLGWLEGTPFGTMSGGCDGTTNRCHAYLPPSPLLTDLTPQQFTAAQKIAEESAVLLKNDGNLLPVTSADMTGANRVVVMGANAFVTYVGGGGSAQVIPFVGAVPSAYDTMFKSVPAGSNLTSTLGYAVGATIDGFPVPSQGGSVAHAASAAYPVSGIGAGSGFLREQTTYGVVAAGAAATHCTVGDPGCAADQTDASVAYNGLTSALTLPVGTAWRWTGAVTAPATNGPWQLRVCYGSLNANATDGAVQLYASGSALPANPASTDRVVNVTGASATNLDIFGSNQCRNPGGSQQGAAATGAGTLIPNGAIRNIELRADANGTKPLTLYLEWAPVGTNLAAASLIGATNVKVGSVAGFTVGQTVAVDSGTNQEAAVIAAIGTAGSSGTGIDLVAPLALAHANNASFAGQTMQDAVLADAVAQASVPGTTPVVFVYDVGTEGSDRGNNNAAAGMVLPGYQDLMVQKVVDANPNTIVVAMTGAPVYMPWAMPQVGHNAVKSILQMWYPGQRGGIATANVVLGSVNPGGKLPETFPVDATHYPQYENGCDGINNLGQSSSSSRNMTAVGTCSLYPGVYMPGFLATATTGNLHNYRTLNFSNSTLQDTGVSANPSLTYPDSANPTATVPTTTGNGIFTGYRWFDKNNVAPMFEFGRGLSYTTFAYSNLAISAGTAGGAVDVSFDLKNTGTVAGDETPQIYIGSPASPAVPMAVNALAGFQRIHLAAGATQHITIHAALRSFQYWKTTAANFANNDTDGWATATGCRTISVGTSSRVFPLVGMADQTGAPCATTTTLTDDFATTKYGQPTTMTATVSNGGAPGALPVTGFVQFDLDGTNIGTPVALVNGVATYTTSTIAIGTHVKSAHYLGDANNAPSSATANHTVKKRLGTTTVVSPTTTVGYSAPWALTTTVTPENMSIGVAPTGTLTLKLDASSAHPITAVLPIAGGTVTTANYSITIHCTWPPLSCTITINWTAAGAPTAGRHTVRAIYNGDLTNYTGSTSAMVVQQVNKVLPTGAVTPPTTPIVYGTRPTFLATFTNPVAPVGSLAPASVQFWVDGTYAATVAIAPDGTASWTPAYNLLVGNHLIRAKYMGNSDFVGLTTAAVPLKVTAH
jgi:hypothetical protein